MKHIKIFDSQSAFDAANVEAPYLVSVAGSIAYSGNVISEDALTKGDWIDLGLPSGKLWASRNIGANSVDDPGNYYAWAETETKSVYDESTAKYYYEWYYTKYNNCEDYSYYNYITMDNLNELELEDDVAYQFTNGEGHMPSVYDFAELVDNTELTYTWCKIIGHNHDDNPSLYVDGVKFTGKNGNSIFIPDNIIIMGDYHDYGLLGIKLWTNTKNYLDDITSDKIDTSCLDWNKGGHAALTFYTLSGATNFEYTDRMYGLPVRAVKDSK